jgi:chromate transport protein ChrA
MNGSETLQRTPKQYAQIAFLGSLTTLLMVPLAFLLLSHTDHLSRLEAGLYFAFALTPVAVAAIVCNWGRKKLEQGLTNDLWAEAAIEAARDWVRTPLVKATPLVLILAFLACDVIYLLHPRPHHGFNPTMFLFVWWIPNSTYVQLTQLLLPSPRRKPTD